MQVQRLDDTAEMLVQRLDDTGTIPTHATSYAAGWDLYSAETIIIPPQDKKTISTKIAIALPLTHSGKIEPRSGLAAKHHIDVGAGTIDPDYTGELLVVLFNHSKTPYEVTKGDRIAQLVIRKYVPLDLTVVDKLPTRDRGTAGFGSTGK